MSYQLINAVKVAEIKNILLNSSLREAIHIEVSALDLCFRANALSITEPSSRFDAMEEVYLMNGESVETLCVKNRKYEVFFCIGDWGYETRLPYSHICLGTNPIKFGSAYFAQLELSYSLEDAHSIYIVKNISKLAGKGAISRLNKGLGADKPQKRERRSQLRKKLGGELISFERHDWLSLCKINKMDLANEEKHSDILHHLMQSVLRYAFTVEEIISVLPTPK